MNIVIDARMVDCSGIGTYIQNILRGLSQDVPLIAIGDPEKLKGFPLKDIIPCTAPIYSIKEQLLLPKIIPRCDLFWSPHYNVPLLPIRAKKIIVSIHDVYHLAFFSTLKISEKGYAKVVLKQAVKRSAGIITCSDFSAREITHFFPSGRKKIAVIPYGIHPKIINRAPESFLLTVGNLKPHKNLLNLVKSLAYLDRDLIIVGKKEGLITQDLALFSFLEQHPELSKRVTFTGYVSGKELESLYARAALYVFPSLYEGFGFPILEAMAAGCPVASSSRASLPEVAGDAASYFDPEDPEDIARGIKKILYDEPYRKELITKGQKRILLFNWKECCQLHFEYIQALI